MDEQELDQRIATVTVKSAETLTELRTLVIENQEEYELAAQQDAEWKRAFEVIETMRRELTDPLNGVVKKLNAKAKPATTFLDTARALLRASMGRFLQAREQEAQRLLEAAAAQSRTGDTQAAGQSLALLDGTQTRTAGISSRDQWFVVSIDRDKLPAEYFMPDMTKIEALVKQQIAIPGVVVDVRKIITNRGGK